jgi:hypothetical protein
MSIRWPFAEVGRCLVIHDGIDVVVAAASDQVVKLLALDAAQNSIIGRKVRSLSHHSTISQCDLLLFHTRSNQEFSSNLMLLKPNGKPLPASVTTRPIAHNIALISIEHWCTRSVLSSSELYQQFDTQKHTNA